VPIECPKITETDLELTKDYQNRDQAASVRSIHDAAEKAAFLRTYIEKEFSALSHPLSVAYRRFEPKRRVSDHCFHIVGYPSAMAEAILIRTALSILNEEGHKHLIVEINSMGDKDSISLYERELHNYARKAACDIPAEYKKALKDDIFELLNLDLPEPLRQKLPPSIASLSAPSRAHFKEMLECLEKLGVDFKLDHTLIGSRHYASQTIFAIKDLDSDSVLAKGSRYTRLSKRVGFKKEVHAVSATVFGSPKAKETSKKIYKELPKPKFYLIQLGREAKMKSLPLIEHLRQNRIPIYHFLGKDKITAQLMSAEALRVPYLLILGQKEALDDTVTIRNTATRAQDTVHISLLPDYLKNIAL
jgi:histidyl-tRNA synthetase